MSIEAMKQALEALESKYIVNCGAWRLQQDEAITALRQAIAEAEKQPVHDIDMSEKCVDKTAKHGHEPVAWHEPGAYGNVTTHKDWALANGWKPLYKEKNNGNTN